MEENPEIQMPQSAPPHRNRMVMSILITLFCCLIGGIIAIIYSSKSNNLYTQAMITMDSELRQYLYLESEAKNKTAGTWIWISILGGVLTYAAIIALAVGAALMD